MACESVIALGTKYWCACLLVYEMSCFAGFGVLAPGAAINYQLWRLHVTAKVCDNSSKLESGSMLHGKVMVFLGKLSDNSPAVAKLPATNALLRQEVWVHHVPVVAELLSCCCASLHRQKRVQCNRAGKQSL